MIDDNGTDNAERARGELVPQPHGGALWRGVGPNHVGGGPGRPPSLVRAAFRESLFERRPVLEKIADDENVSPSDRTRAMDVLGKYSGTTESMTVTVISPEVQSRLDQTIQVIRDVLPEPEAEALLDKLSEVWR